MEEMEIPENVRSTPADKDGNGFIVPPDLWVGSLVGDDGRIYTRKDGAITVDEE